MTDSQRLALLLSELRVKINDFDHDAGDTADLDKMTSEYRKSESEYRAAVIAEDADTGPARNSHDGEGAELRRLRDAADFGNYLLAAAARRGVVGAEADYNAARGLSENGFPLEMLVSPEPRRL